MRETFDADHERIQVQTLESNPGCCFKHNSVLERSLILEYISCNETYDSRLTGHLNVSALDLADQVNCSLHHREDIKTV